MYRLTSTQELCQRFTQTTYDGVDYNEHRANVHLSPRGAHWKAFSARYFIPPLAFSIVLGDTKYQVLILWIPGSRMVVLSTEIVIIQYQILPHGNVA